MMLLSENISLMKLRTPLTMAGTSLRILLLSVALLTCKNQPDEPAPNPPGKREYGWSIDTISYPGSLQTFLTRMWGSSSSDLYIGGHNERGWGELYHYDGKNWNVVIHGFRAIDVGEIFGFSSNDVYVAGGHPYLNPTPPPHYLDSSVVIHFNGTSWKEVGIPKGRELQAFFATGKSDLYGGGIFGTLFRGDGATWKTIPSDTSIFYNNISGGANEILVLGYTPNGYSRDGLGKEYLFEWRDSALMLLKTDTLSYPFQPTFPAYRLLCLAGDWYGVGHGVFKRSGTTWERVISVGGTFLSIFGTRREHIFVCGLNNSLYHFNGTDWKRLDIPGDSSLPLFRVWCNESEVFVLGSDGARSYVIHGR